MLKATSKKSRHLSRLVVKSKDPTRFKTMEVNTLQIGIWINIFMGICGWIGYYFADSYALALDGNFSFISALSFFVAMRITRQKDFISEKYPLGFYSVENIYAFLQGILLIGITVYAILQGAANIVAYSKGELPETLKILPLMIYTVTMIFACIATWFFYKRRFEKTEKQSPILKAETVAAFMDMLVTCGTGVALVAVAMVPPSSSFHFLNYIGDSIIVIIISLFLLRAPIQIVSNSFFSLIGRTIQIPQLRHRVENIIVTSLDPIFKLEKFHIFHMGSCYEIEVTIRPVDDALMNLPLFRMCRQLMETRLKVLFPSLVLEVIID